jgi:hypothetical protein
MWQQRVAKGSRVTAMWILQARSIIVCVRVIKVKEEISGTKRYRN